MDQTLETWQPKPSGARLMLRIDLGQQDVEIIAPDGHIYDIAIDHDGAPHLVRIDKETE